MKRLEQPHRVVYRERHRLRSLLYFLGGALLLPLLPFFWRITAETFRGSFPGGLGLFLWLVLVVPFLALPPLLFAGAFWLLWRERSLVIDRRRGTMVWEERPYRVPGAPRCREVVLDRVYVSLERRESVFDGEDPPFGLLWIRVRDEAPILFARRRGWGVRDQLQAELLGEDLGCPVGGLE